MSASKVRRQREHAAEIRAELERLPMVNTPFMRARREGLQKELAALRFKDKP